MVSVISSIPRVETTIRSFESRIRNLKTTIRNVESVIPAVKAAIQDLESTTRGFETVTPHFESTIRPAGKRPASAPDRSPPRSLWGHPAIHHLTFEISASTELKPGFRGLWAVSQLGVENPHQGLRPG